MEKNFLRCSGKRIYSNKVYNKENYCGGEKMSNTKQQVKLDEEWVDLILTALEIGLPVEEIRNFLKDVKQA